MNRITFSPRWPPEKRWRLHSRRLELELLEERNLLSITNVLVNNPAEDTIPMQDTQSESAIVLGAGSNVVVAYNDTGSAALDTTGHVFSGTKATGFSLSTNGGASFVDQGTVATNPYGDLGDPVLARSIITNTIFLSTLSTPINPYPNPVLNQINVFRSVDNGASFAPPVTPAPPPPAAIANFDDKPWITVDNFPGAGQGNVYLAWSRPTNFFEGIQFSRSTDDGLTWGPSGGVQLTSPPAGAPLGANVVVGPNHEVYVLWDQQIQKTLGNAFQNQLVMRKSTDLGVTFGPSQVVADLRYSFGEFGLTDTAGQSFRVFTWPQAAVNPQTGDIYVVYNDKPETSLTGNGVDLSDIFFTESSDGGNTWSKSIQLNDDKTKNDQWQPAIAVTPDGQHVGVFWYDRRLDQANNLIDRFGVIGTVSGHTVSFAPNFRITDVSFPPAFGQDPFVVPTYMGDYDQATADNNYFYTTWGDNRLSDAFFANQPDVRFAKIPVGEDDAATATTLAVAPAAITQASATTSLDSGLPLDPTILLPTAIGPALVIARTAAPVHSSSSHAQDAVVLVQLATSPQATARQSLLDARDIVFAAAGPAAPDESPLDNLSLGTL
jgi:hypothetical protein